MTLRNKLFIAFLVTIMANSLVLLVFSIPFVKEIDFNAQSSHITETLLSIKNDLLIENDILNNTGMADIYFEDAKREAKETVRKKYTHILNDGMEIIILHFRSNKLVTRINPNKGLDIEKLLSSMPIKKAKFEGKELVVKTWHDNYYIHGLSFEPWEWFIIFAVEENSLYANLQRIVSIFLLSTLISLIICLIISKVVITHFIGPLDSLKKIASRLAQGDLETSIPLTRSDEIGELSQAFDTMRSSIKSKINNIEKMNNELESTVAERTKELTASNKSLNSHIKKTKNLVRVLCHDLANSIGIVKSANFLLKSKKSIKNPDKIWDKVDLAVKNQIDLIEQVRTIEANESGKIKLDLVPVDMVEILKNSYDLMEYNLADKKLSFSYPDQKSFFVIAEATSLLNNVINNLISNAIKFSFEHSAITIFFRSENSLQVVEIKDQGIGMPQSMMENLFDTYKETSRLGTSGEKGTGFGMPLVKSYMELYGGSIEVQSIEKSPEAERNENHGTRFILKFKRSQS